jgi:spermidine/putrescine transport system permease protein
MKQQEFRATFPSLLWLLFFVAVPTCLIFYIAAKPATSNGGIGEGWSLEAIKALADPHFPAIVLRTLWISFVTTALCLGIALPVAWTMARANSRWKQWLLLLVVVPFWTNFLIRVFAWKQILHAEGILATLLKKLHLIDANAVLLYQPSTVIIVSIYSFLPFAILPLYAAAEKFDFTLLDAARDLGASRIRAIRQVFLPGIRQGLLTAAIVVFIPMLGSYIIPDLVGGKETEMIGNKIAQRNFNDRNLPQAAAISAALTLVVLLPFALRRHKGNQNSNINNRHS